MAQRRLRLALKFRNDALGQHFAKLYAPLVERVDLPDGALREDGVFVESDELAKHLRRELQGENGVRRTIALEYTMRDEPVRRALGLDLLGRFSECQCFRLCEDVRKQHVMLTANCVERLSKGNEVARNQPGPLMNQLIEGVLAVGSRLAPVDRAGRIGDLVPTDRDVLSIALHGQLLEISRKPL